ncbi:MAG TPA: hypothetical protein VGP33_02820, partial [Chloroflexota bacterium]|nr:hypothetical protein [Chloroflexota bacterium]
MPRPWLLLIPLCSLLALALPQTAFAHPLGNFTINHYARLELQPDAIRIRYVLDEAEIPTYQELAMLHPGAGKPTAQEEQTFLAARVELLRGNLHLTVAGQPLPLAAEPGTSTLNFPPGQGGLSLLRMTVWFRATLPDGGTTPRDATFRDDNDRDRLGWKEIVVRAAGASLLQSSATAVDQSDELRSYPQDMLSSPLDVQSAQFTFTPAAPAGGRSAAFANLLQPRGRSVGILQASSDAFTALVSRQNLSPL